MVYFLILGGAFLTMVFLVLGIHQVSLGPRLAVLQRLEADPAASDTSSPQPEAYRRKGPWRGALDIFGMLGNILPQRKDRKAIQLRLIQAHVLMRAEEFIGFSVFVALAAFLLVYLITNVFVAIPAALIGFKVPAIIVDMKKNKRMNSLTLQLPEALGIISSGLRAGYSFPQAMSVVSKEMGAPIGDEFSRVLRENRMGKPMDEALQDLGERTDSEDLDLFITALVIQRQVGGNLAEILDNISHTIRERVRIKGEIQTLTVQARLSAVIIILLPLALAAFMFLANPEYILLLFQHPLGLGMIIAAVVLQLIGIMIIRKIIKIDI